MPGHVFVVQGDLTHLACDDWLLPSDDSRHVTPSWWRPETEQGLRAIGAWRYDDADQGWARDIARDERVVPFPDGSYRRPRPWLVSVQGDPVANAVAFVRAVTRGGHGRFLRRARRLIAVPVVGTGWGGLRYAAGDVLAELMPALAEAVASDDVAADVAVVTFSLADFAAAQHAR